MIVASLLGYMSCARCISSGMYELHYLRCVWNIISMTSALVSEHMNYGNGSVLYYLNCENCIGFGIHEL